MTAAAGEALMTNTPVRLTKFESNLLADSRYRRNCSMPLPSCTSIHENAKTSTKWRDVALYLVQSLYSRLNFRLMKSSNAVNTWCIIWYNHIQYFSEAKLTWVLVINHVQFYPYCLLCPILIVQLWIVGIFSSDCFSLV